MDLEQRLGHLESHNDWQAVIDLLEQSIASTSDPAAKAELHLRAGMVLRQHLMQSVRALKHFQDAFKQNSALLSALEQARTVYWELGKLNMVQKLLELSLKNTSEPAVSAMLQVELGNLLADQGEVDAALAAYAGALQAGGGAAVSALLEELQSSEETWQEHVSGLLRSAHGASASAEQVDYFLRASRLARRFAPEALEGMLEQAYRADPTHTIAAALYESLVMGQERGEALLEVQRQWLEGASGPVRAAGALSMAARWALWHQNAELAEQRAELALREEPSLDAAFALLRESRGQKRQDWGAVVAIAEEAARSRSDAGSVAYLLAAAGFISWREQGDLIRARRLFERLAAVDPGHPGVQAFELQIGESLTGGSVEAMDGAASDSIAPVAAASEAPPPAAPASVAPSAPSVTPPPASVAPAAPSVAPAAPSVAPPSASAAPSSRASVAPSGSGGGDPDKIAEYRAKVEGLDPQKRANEYVRAVLALADELVDPVEKTELYLKAADLYVNRFANQAEAVKAYEKVLESDAANAEAISYLQQMYEKRRDWEKLITLNRREADALGGSARSAAYKEIAKLATERVKKPEVCIELWLVVLEDEPMDPEALEALAGLYERSREYEQLADILEKLADVTFDTKAKVEVLVKLGQVVGDRLKDEERAVSAYQMLLTLQPDDRRAQEQLKKRYTALGRWDDLEVFYAESGKWDEFIRILESNEAKETETPKRISMLMKIAELWMTQKGKVDRASRAYEKVLSYDEQHLPAAVALIPIYEAAGNPKGLAGVLEVKLAHSQIPGEQLTLLRQVAALYEGKVNDKAKAFARFVAAFELDPSDAESQADVDRAAGATGRWDDLIQAYRAAIQRAESDSDFTTVTALRLRLGRVLVDEVGRVDEALVEYRAVYDAEPENTTALAALEKLYRQTERWRDLLEVYSKKRELAEDFEQKKQILYETARLYELQLSDSAAAIETYQAVLEEDPADAVALESLDRLYGVTEQWAAYAEILGRRIELDVSEETLVDLKYRLAQAQAVHLGDAGSALENYREILFLNQDHEGARLALEGMLAEEQHSGEAASILESIYEAREDWEKLIGALEILARSDAEAGRRVELLRKMAATAAQRLNDVPRALEAQARALKEDPALTESRLELEAFAESAGTWDRLIAIFSEIAAAVTDPSLAREYWLRVAATEERLGQVKAAAESYEKVLALNAADGEALAAMDALYRRAEYWEDLVGVYRRRIELATDGEAREALYAQMAQVYEERLSKPEEAINAYREVLALEPSSGVALAALDALFTRQRMWGELAENLETQLQLAETDEQQLGLMLRLAALQEGEMGAVDAAIEGYRQVLDRDAANEAALSALERLGRSPEHELAIADLLEPLYRQSGDYRKLIGVHEVQVRRAEDAARKVELLHQVAALHEDAGGDANAAFETLARALAVDPAHEDTQGSLERLASVTGRFLDLANVLEQLGAQQRDAELASALFMSAARTLENAVGDVERAIELYRRVLQVDPVNLGAAEALQALFLASERYADMSLILQRKAEILEDMDAQKQALYEAARLEEEVLERKEAAIGVYLKVLELDGEDLRSIDALINLYLGLSRWEELLGAYAQKVELILDTEEKKLIYYQVGAVHERELQDIPRAIDTYQKVLELDPDDLTALGRLDVLYQAAGNWQELLAVLTHEAELTADVEEAVSYQYRIAALYEKHLGDVERAVELYREILNVQPGHAPTLQALEGIKGGDRAALAAAGVLEPVYDAMGEWQRLISVLEVQAKHAEDGYSQVELLHRIARLYEESLGDHAGAFSVYARAVQVDSANEESLASLERLGMTIDRWTEVARLYDAEFDKLTEEPERFVELGLRVAQVYEVQLEDVDSAVVRYRRILEVEPENQNALRALDRLFTQTERWSDLVDILRREADIGESPDEILEFKYRLGQTFQLRLHDVASAIESYREVISAVPEHEQSLAALEGLFASGIKQIEVAEILDPLYQSAGEWEKLLKVREAQLANTTEPEQRIAMYHRIAEDAEERLMDPVLAFGVHVRAIKESPLDERTGEELERLAGMIDGGWEQLGNAYADVLSIEGLEAAAQAEIGKRLARVFEEELADAARAEETYRYVLTVVPSDEAALENLDRIYSSFEQWSELAGVLERRAVTAPDTRDQVELYTRLGQAYEEHLGQVDDAIRAFRAIFDRLEPTNPDAIQALGRIYAQKEAWGELNAVYVRELENTAGDVEEAEIRAKMAHLAADRLGKIEEAVEGWKRVLELRGEDPEALGALANLYDRQQRWEDLAEVLDRQFDTVDSPEEQVGVLTRRARLFTEQLGRDEDALETWRRVLEIDYSNVTALRAIADIWRRRNDAQELVMALYGTIDAAAALLEASEVVSIYRELGKTYGEVLDQPYDAADAWTKLLEVDPGDFEAMAALEAIYRADERWPDVVNVKMQRATALPEPGEQVRELLEVTEIWKQQVGEDDKATAAFERILAVEPTHDVAFESLEQLHTAAERWEPLIELYLNRLETRESAAEKSDLLRRIARVFEERLGDQNQAFEALVNAFGEDYRDDETVRYLERMAAATGRWGDLINTTNTWLQEQSGDREKIQLCLRLGKWYGDDLGHPEYAQPYYAQVMQMDPHNVQVLRQMAAIHRKSANWQKMGETLTRALSVAVASEDRKVILYELGELLERNMGQADQGVAHYKQALDVDPHYLPALEALERIYDERAAYSDLVEVLAAKVVALTDPEAIAATKLRMGGLFESAIGDFDRAGREYREVLELDGANLFALRGQERVTETLQKWPALVAVLEAQLDVVPSERERVEVLLKLAQIQEEQFLKPEIAVPRLEQALEIDPSEARAYVALERCYRRLKQWLDLINTYERHINEAADQPTKVELYAAIAVVYSDEVLDADRAIEAYRNLVDIDENNIPALDALAKLYDKQGDAAEAIDAMTRVADLTSDGTQRVEMYYRIGRALEDKLSDRVTAQERFEMALDLDPAHLPALAALRAIAMDEADWDRAARYLEQEQLNTEAARQRAKLLVELGNLRAEQLEEPELAIQAYELAIQCDQDNEDAALPLVRAYLEQGRFQEADPLAELLVRKSKNRERAEQHEMHKLLGRVAAALGNQEKALKAFQAAHQLDLTSQESIRGIADAAFALGDWPSALTNYQKVLTALGEEEIEQRTDVYFRLGCVKREQGQAKQAINNFEKALALNGEHRPTLDAMVETYAGANDWKQVAAYKRQILDSVFDGEERYQILNEIGDLWADKEKNAAKAIEALEEARDLKPEDHVLLHKLLKLYQGAKDWQKMCDTIQSIADLEHRPEVRSRYLYTMAQVYRDGLEDLDRAVELFNEALDLNPGYLEAFERINKILTGQKAWQQLERSYRKMLHRLAGKGNTELEHTLWYQLGIIYRDRLGDAEKAIDAFRMASTVKPGEPMQHQILAELFSSAERWDEAIEQQRILLELDPLDANAYQALYQLYLHKQSYDEAWCLAAALSFLRKADAETQEFYEGYRPQGMLPVRGRLSNEAWAKHLFHAEENLYISKIFEMVAPAALQAKHAQLQAQGKLPPLDKRFKQDPATSTITLAKTFGWAAQVLGIAAPELYVRNDVNGGLGSVVALPPASVAGQAVLSGFQAQDLAFLCGKHLTLYRGEHYIKALFPTQAELTVMLFAGVMIAAPNTPMPQDLATQIRATAQELVKYMQPVQLEGLRMVVKRFIEEGAKANIKRWSQAVELTACRAGLLVSGDLEVAKKIIVAEQGLPGDLSAQDKMKELLVFSVSEDYSQLRRALGVAVEA